MHRVGRRAAELIFIAALTTQLPIPTLAQQAPAPTLPSPPVVPSVPPGGPATPPPAAALPSAAGAAAPQPPAADAPAAPAAAPGLVPPRLIEAPEAVYPEAARAARVEASVTLRLSIDVEGHVQEAEVVGPAGQGFDEAARDAMSQARFVPAQRDGQPMAARILYAYAFKLPPEAPPPPPLPTPAHSGQVVTEVVATADAQVTPPPPPGGGVDVTVQGRMNDAKRLQQSAEAVTVVDLYQARQQTADLGEVLARTQGLNVRRSGGLGSDTTLSLNGLDGDQIRFFLDGVPLDLGGYPFGVASVPVNLTERIEIFRGVVPIRFGADALGGAINLVTDQRYQSRASASYQVGSFGTHRVTLTGRYRHDPTGIVLSADGFFDITDNDYDVDVEIPDERGRLSPATVRRFHDGYVSGGGSLEVGVVDKPWAKRLFLRGYVSAYDKDLQHNAVMTVPYGEVRYDEGVYGTTLVYNVPLRSNLELDVVGAYAHRYVDFVDKAEWVYSWTGERIRMRRIGGEIGGQPSDQTEWQNAGYGRALLAWTISPQHSVRLSVSPAYTARTGDERIQADPDARDPLSAKRALFTFVGGLEYEVNLFDERLANIVFVKDYLYRADTEESLTGGIFRKRDTHTHTQGVGDSLRFRFTPWFMAKASYEYTTRLPRPDEVFGDGVLILANLGLEPEVSHNVNIGPRVDLEKTPLGSLTVDINAFLRDSDKLIILLGNDRNFTWQNVYRARGLGLENAVAWSSPGDHVAVDGTFTWQDVRNASNKGTFADFDGDRLPNRPYLFGSWGLRGKIKNLPGSQDAIEPFYEGRWVDEFFRGWESQGLREFKQVVDSQVTHSIGVTWTWHQDFALITTTLEIDNLLDAAVFDHFGVQRPGRAFYFKVMGELR